MISLCYRVKHKPWRIQGARAPLFLAKSILFFTLYTNNTMSGKNIFEIEFGFYSGRNPRSFWKYGWCMRVCVNRNRGRYCFLFSKAQFWMISEAILIPKIYARLHEMASNFLKKFLGRPFAGARAFGARFGASPPYRASPFQNFWIRPWQIRVCMLMAMECCQVISLNWKLCKHSSIWSVIN